MCRVAGRNNAPIYVTLCGWQQDRYALIVARHYTVSPLGIRAKAKSSMLLCLQLKQKIKRILFVKARWWYQQCESLRATTDTSAECPCEADTCCAVVGVSNMGADWLINHTELSLCGYVIWSRHLCMVCSRIILQWMICRPALCACNTHSALWLPPWGDGKGFHDISGPGYTVSLRKMSPQAHILSHDISLTRPQTVPSMVFYSVPLSKNRWAKWAFPFNLQKILRLCRCVTYFVE